MNAAMAPGGGGPLSEALDAPPTDLASSDGLPAAGGTAGGSTQPATGGDLMMGGISDGGLSTPAVPTEGELSLVLFILQHRCKIEYALVHTMVCPRPRVLGAEDVTFLRSSNLRTIHI